MSRRLRLTYLSVFGVALLVLVVALAVAVASDHSRRMFIDRQNDAERYAELAAPALATGQTYAMQADLDEYDRLYGVHAVLVSQDGVGVLSSRGLPDEAATRYRGAVDAALSGERSAPTGPAWPWRSDPMVVAEPVGSGGEVIGVMLTVSPTGTLRRTVLAWWALLAGGAILVLFAGAVAARGLARWLVRPLRALSAATEEIAQGRMSRRVATSAGPPELREFATSFNTMTDRLAGLIDRQRTFVSYASHQLRTPLATVRLRVETLAAFVRPEGGDEQLLALDEVDRLSRTCDALLAFAVGDATSPEIVDAAAVLDDRLRSWRGVATRGGAALTASVPRPLTVLAARDTLDQVLDALIDNALKFAGDDARVAVTAERVDERWVEIHVVDNGPGMTDEQRARAAEPRWREPTDRNIAGSGLGLTIVSALVTASGGALDLRPAPPRGVDAVVRLLAAPPAPLTPDPDGADAPADADRAAAR
ncbi:MAG TPA: HAMP domain-containing sensor histidine kinase [Actinocatenispora sp.]